MASQQWMRATATSKHPALRQNPPIRIDCSFKETELKEREFYCKVKTSSGVKEERKSLVVKVTEEDVELLIRAGIEFEEAASPEKQNFDTASKLKSNYEDVLCPTLRTDFKDIYGRYGDGSTPC